VHVFKSRFCYPVAREFGLSETQASRPLREQKCATTGEPVSPYELPRLVHGLLPVPTKELVSPSSTSRFFLLIGGRLCLQWFGPLSSSHHVTTPRAFGCVQCAAWATALAVHGNPSTHSLGLFWATPANPGSNHCMPLPVLAQRTTTRAPTTPLSHTPPSPPSARREAPRRRVGARVACGAAGRRSSTWIGRPHLSDTLAWVPSCTRSLTRPSPAPTHTHT